MYGKGYKISGEKNGSYGKGNSKGKHWKVKNRKPMQKGICIICGKEVPNNILARYHNEKCKYKI